MVEGRFAPPVLTSSIKQLYRTGALKICCLVLQLERFDVTKMKQAWSTERSPTIISVPSRSGERFLLLHCVGMVTNVYKVVNGTTTRKIKKGLKVHTRKRGYRFENFSIPFSWEHPQYREIDEVTPCPEIPSRSYHPLSPLASTSKHLGKYP